MINRKAFFDAVRKDLFSGKLTVRQVEGLEFILDVYEKSYKDTISIPQLAYCLATAYHETAFTMQPIEEFGKGRGKKYGIQDYHTGRTYYGRGYVQLTWKENYARAEDKLGIRFVTAPQLALVPEYAAHIMFIGMDSGWFTGKKLDDYINTKSKDFKNARRIINGTDCATQIAAYAEKFAKALGDK